MKTSAKHIGLAVGP